MVTISIQGIKEILNNPDTIFMKKGKNGNVVHLSDGAVRENNLLCGVTYSRNGNRQSYLFPFYKLEQIDTASMCKNCFAIVHTKVQSVKVGN